MINIADYGKEIVSLLVPFVTWLLNVGIKPRAKLIWTLPHSFNFLVQEPVRDAQGNILQPTQMVYTAERVNDFATPSVMNLLRRGVVFQLWLSPWLAG